MINHGKPSTPKPSFGWLDGGVERNFYSCNPTRCVWRTGMYVCMYVRYVCMYVCMHIGMPIYFIIIIIIITIIIVIVLAIVIALDL